MTKRMYNASVIAERIKTLRKEKGITQKELADGAKIGLSTVKQYETGKRVPEKHNLSLIANYFGVLEGWIVGDTPYKTIFEKIDGELGEERLSDLRLNSCKNLMKKSENL